MARYTAMDDVIGTSFDVCVEDEEAGVGGACTMYAISSERFGPCQPTLSADMLRDISKQVTVG
jgi:hypothetical protein